MILWFYFSGLPADSSSTTCCGSFLIKTEELPLKPPSGSGKRHSHQPESSFSQEEPSADSKPQPRGTGTPTTLLRAVTSRNPTSERLPPTPASLSNRGAGRTVRAADNCCRRSGDAPPPPSARPLCGRDRGVGTAPSSRPRARYGQAGSKGGSQLVPSSWVRRKFAAVLGVSTARREGRGVCGAARLHLLLIIHAVLGRGGNAPV